MFIALYIKIEKLNQPIVNTNWKRTIKCWLNWKQIDTKVPTDTHTYTDRKCYKPAHPPAQINEDPEEHTVVIILFQGSCEKKSRIVPLLSGVG